MTTALFLAASVGGLVYIGWELRRIAVECKEWAAISREMDEFYRERRRPPRDSNTPPGSSADRAPVS